MNRFDALLLLDLALVLVAWVRIQPAAFVWMGQQCVTLRAFSNIETYGEPTTQWWLPPSLFDKNAQTIAFGIFLLSTLISAAVMLKPAPHAEPALRSNFKPLPRWLNVMVWLFFLAATLSHKSIFSAASTAEDAKVFTLNFGGGNALMCGLLLYDFELRRAAGRVSGVVAFAIVCTVFIVSFLLKGATGYVTGCMVFAAFLFLSRAKVGRLPGYLTIALAVLSLVVVTAIVRQVRGSLSTEGSRAVSAAVDTIQDSEATRASTGTGVEALMNGDQSAAHVCECIHLWESNLGRGWRSIYYPIIYTFEPAFLLEPLGIVRPREAAYELMDYYLHMGGIQALGEMYWNGGFLCVAIVVAMIALLSRRCDLKYETSGYWLMMACNYVPSVFVGGHYGFAQIARGVFNGLIGCALLRFFGKSDAPKVSA